MPLPRKAGPRATICLMSLRLFSKKRNSWNRLYPLLACRIDLHLSTIAHLEVSAHFRADLIISELLGSFGDNELAPECMAHAHRFLSPRGVMIPANSTSYLLPVCYPRSRRLVAKWSRGLSARPTPSVVYTTSATHLTTEKIPIFHYDYTDLKDCLATEKLAKPRFDLFIHNSNAHRSDRFMGNSVKNQSEESIEHSGTNRLDGFMGYFEAQLFGDHSLSIFPYSDQQAGQDSWFPIFFPSPPRAKDTLPKSITLAIKRVSEGAHAWYEWELEDYKGGP